MEMIRLATLLRRHADGLHDATNHDAQPIELSQLAAQLASTETQEELELQEDCRETPSSFRCWPGRLSSRGNFTFETLNDGDLDFHFEQGSIAVLPLPADLVGGGDLDGAHGQHAPTVPPLAQRLQRRIFTARLAPSANNLTKSNLLLHDATWQLKGTEQYGYTRDEGASDGEWLVQFCYHARREPVTQHFEHLLRCRELAQQVVSMLSSPGSEDGTEGQLASEDAPDGTRVSGFKLLARPILVGTGRAGFHEVEDGTISTPGHSEAAMEEDFVYEDIHDAWDLEEIP